MATNRSPHLFFVFVVALPNLFKLETPLLIPALFLLAGLAAAQQTTQPTALDQLPDGPVPRLLAQAAAPEVPAGNRAKVAIPAGTRLELVLTHPVDSHSKTPGDEIFAQTSAPVIVADEVAIPAGTFVRGKVEKLTRHGTRAEMLMQSVSLVLPNGYIAHAGGPANIESEQWTAWNNPSGAAKAAIILARSSVPDWALPSALSPTSRKRSAGAP